jgi:hypothetical protein
MNTNIHGRLASQTDWPGRPGGRLATDTRLKYSSN